MAIFLFFIYISAISVYGGTFGNGTGPVFVGYVTCNGTEFSILSCSRWETGIRCSHSEDIGVICPPGKSCTGWYGGKFPLCFVFLSECTDATSTEREGQQPIKLIAR